MKRISKIILCMCLLLSLTLSSFAATSVPESVMKAKDSVVRVLAEYSDGGATGSGFVVVSDKNQTIIVTNYHVVAENPYNISVWVGEEETISARILAYSDQKDLCILELSYPIPLNALKLSDAGAKQGDAVYAVGYPGAADFLSDKEAHTSEDATITDGIVSAVREVTVSGYGTPVAFLQISAAINEGNSGGPLFDEKGEVVGVNTCGIVDSQGIFGAVEIHEVIDFLQDNGISISRGTGTFLWIVLAAIGVVLVFGAILVLKKKSKLSIPVSDSKEELLRECVEIDIDSVGEVGGKQKGKIVAIIVVVVLFGLQLIGGLGAYACAFSNHFEAAEKLLFISPITKLCAGKLTNYVEAGQLMEKRNYDAAKQVFSSLSGYMQADSLVKEADYRYALQCADANDFDEALKIMAELEQNGYADAQEKIVELKYRNGVYLLYKEGQFIKAGQIFAILAREGYEPAEEMVMEASYLWAMDMIDNEQYVDAYQLLSNIKDYSDTEEVMEVLAEILYLEGIDNYHKGNFGEASKAFRCIGDYADSPKYLTLISGRSPQWDVEDSLLEDLITIFDFEDAAEVLLCSQELAEQFLCGTWRGDGYYFTMDEDGGISYNLPWLDYGDYYKIEDGMVLLYPDEDENDTRQLFAFAAISPDCVDVYCYKNSRVYTLYRQ